MKTNSRRGIYGALLLENSDTVTGLIKLLPYVSNRPDFLLIPIIRPADSVTKKITTFPAQHIRSVRIFADSTNGYAPTSFVRIGPKIFWRVLAEKNNAGIYNYGFYTPEQGKYFSPHHPL